MNIQKVYALQAMGKGKEALILGVIRQGLFAIPTLIILSKLLGSMGVIAAPLISDGLTFIVSTIVYKITYNKISKELKLC